MNINFFLNYISKYISVDEKLKLAIMENFEYIKIKEKEPLHIAGGICDYQYFILSGFVRSFYTDKNGKEHTIIFLCPEWWASDLNSFFNRVPSDYSLMAIQDTEVLRISHSAFEKLLSKNIIMESFFRQIYQSALISQHIKVVRMLSLSSKERYEAFIQQYPDLPDYISYKDIATYLNMTPEHLSYLRKNM